MDYTDYTAEELRAWGESELIERIIFLQNQRREVKRNEVGALALSLLQDYDEETIENLSEELDVSMGAVYDELAQLRKAQEN